MASKKSYLVYKSSVLIRRQTKRQNRGGHALRAHVLCRRQNVHLSAKLSSQGAKAVHVCVSPLLRHSPARAPPPGDDGDCDGRRSCRSPATGRTRSTWATDPATYTSWRSPLIFICVVSACSCCQHVLHVLVYQHAVASE